MEDPREAKRRARRRVRAGREPFREAAVPTDPAGPATPPSGPTSLTSAALADERVAAARCVACYVPTPGEPDTRELIGHLHARGVRVLLPFWPASGPMTVGWAAYGGESIPRLGPRPWSPPGPDLGPGALAEADVVLVAALAVDAHGTRLGQGAGWYDRALAHARPGVAVLAVLHPGEFPHPADLPREDHDRPVDGVIDADGVHRWA